MTFIPYHSGVPENIELPKEVQDAARATSGHAVLTPQIRGVSESIRAAAIARSGLEAAAARITTPAVGDSFWLHFWTDQWRPNYRVTVRCKQAGWSRDIFGKYRFGGWHFELLRSDFPDGLLMKFVLNGSVWMEESDQQVQSDQNHHFYAGQVTFDTSAERYRLGFDDLVSETNQAQQQVLPPRVHETTEYDIIVVGSGMGGGILADALSDRGQRTLILEAGGLVLPSHINNLAGDWTTLPARHQVLNFENLPNSKFLFGVQISLGGRSVYWSGLIPRMRDWEMEQWPHSLQNDLRNRYYDLAETVLGKQQEYGPFQERLIGSLAAHFNAYEVLDLPRSNDQPNLNSGNQLVDVLEKSTGTFSTADLLLDSAAYEGLAGRDHLNINLNHLVTRIEVDGTFVRSVVCQDLVGNVERRYQARDIVLCAGSLESPRIALASGLSDPTGKIGRGLTDHPAYFSDEYPIPAMLNEAPHPYGDPGRHAKILMRHKHATSSDHAFNVEILLNPWHWDVRHPDDDLRKQRLGTKTQAAIRFTFTFESLLDDANHIVYQGADRKLAVHVKPNLTGKDFHAACKQLRNDILSFLRVPNPDPGRDLGYGNQGTPHHAGGSLRMSSNGTGVVDTNLKFEAYNNLYACDVSVFPTIPCANPSLTLSALALRLADHLVSKHHQ